MVDLDIEGLGLSDDEHEEEELDRLNVTRKKTEKAEIAMQ